MKRHWSLHQTANYVEIWIQQGSLPRRRDIAGATLPLSLFASVLSVSGILCQDEPLIMQSSSHFPSEDKAKTKKGNILSSNDGRSYIFLWGSMAV